jgi:Domain of unknown function (DUF4157)
MIPERTCDAASARRREYEDYDSPNPDPRTRPGNCSGARSDALGAAQRSKSTLCEKASRMDRAPPWEGAPVAAAKTLLSNPVSQGLLGMLGAFFSGFASTFREVGETIANGVWDAIRAIPMAVLSNTRSAGEFFAKLAVGIVTAIGAPIIRAAQAVQMLFGLEASSRKISGAERALAARIFGPSLALGKIAIRDGRAGIADTNDRALTIGNDIYMKHLKQLGSDGMQYRAILMHELTHSWQYQQSGMGYIPRALGAQVSSEGYTWKAGFERGVPFRALNPEQQAELVKDAVMSQWFDAPNPENKPFIKDGKDCSAYLKAALIEIRNGRGA